MHIFATSKYIRLYPLMVALEVDFNHHAKSHPKIPIYFVQMYPMSWWWGWAIWIWSLLILLPVE